MRLQTEMVATFCARWESRIPDVAINRAVYSTFPELRRLQPPINPFAIAASHGIQIVPVAMEYDGLLSRSESGHYLIELNKSQPDTRKRFTVAHELGHTLFLDSGAHRDDSPIRLRETQLGKLGADSVEERLCNIAAAEILMPSLQFAACLQRVPSPESIIDVARQFETSIHATARRAVELGRHRIAVCLWRYRDSHEVFETEWVTCPGHSPDQLFVTQEEPFFKSLRCRERFKGRRWLSLGGPVQDYFVEGLPLRSGKVLTVITFGRRRP
jgi:hypothetical protein